MTQTAFDADMLLALRQPAIRVPMHASPDGSALAVTVQTRHRAADLGGDTSYTAQGIPTEMVGSRVLIADTATGGTTNPFPLDSTSWGAQWSPDGSRIAAYLQHEGPACLATWDCATGEFRAYPDALVRPFFGFEVPRWTPDSRSVVVKLRAADAAAEREGAGGDNEATADGARVSVFSFDPESAPDEGPLPGWADGFRCDLGAVDVATGEVRRLAGGWRLVGWKVSPRGGEVAVLRYTEAAQELQQFYYDLSIVPFGGGEPRVVARRVPQDYGVSFNWSPDGSRIAYSTEERGQRGRLFVVPADGSEEPTDLSHPDEDMELAGGTASPLWSPDGAAIYCRASGGHWRFAADGGARERVRIETDGEVIGWVQRPTDGTLWMPEPGVLVEIVRDPQTGDTVLARIDAETGRIVTSARLERGWFHLDPVWDVEGVPKSSTAYLPLEASDHPPEVWAFDAQLGARRLLTLNPEIEGVALGRTRLVEYRALDGERRRATLLLPAGYAPGGTAPLIVDVYGGQLGSHLLHHFGGDEGLLHGQLLAARGYAVLYPDLPLEDRDPLRQLPGLVLPAIDRLIEEGIADPERVGLTGHSYGGYCALALLVQTRRFHAAVASAGFYNLPSVYGTMTPDGGAQWLGWAETGQGRMGGTLWERRDAYIENSPLFYLDRVTTPVLLVCGSEDFEAPIQAVEVFVGLRRLGKRVELARYEGEGHWPGMWSAASYRDLCARTLRWFGEHLSPGS